LAELREGMKNVKGVTVTDNDVDMVMAAVDSNHNGAIDYTEFIAACL